jgi:cyclohexadieny/prephenate dehydrogenase
MSPEMTLALARRETPLFSRLAIVGLGLIGSSIARAVRQANLAHTLIGIDVSKGVRLKVAALELVDEIYSDVAEGVVGADAVILCVPVGACETIARDMAPALEQSAIVSDVGSTKASFIQQVAPYLPDYVSFVPAHPVAGTEQSGPEAGMATLFVNRWCILTPLPDTSAQAIAKIRQLWEAMGSLVEEMTPTHHDLVLAMTSHVPHLIAYNIVGTAADLEHVTQSEVIKFSAGGFRDFTRIASSDPVMWRDVFLNNREAVLEILGRFNEDLATLAKAIRWGDGAMLEEFFTRSRLIRRGIVQLGQAERDDKA